MSDFLHKVIENNWLKYKSIPAVIIILAAFMQWRGGDIIDKLNPYVEISSNCLFVISCCLIGIYIIGCIFHNALPKAGKNNLAVLFVINTENEKIFKTVKYKLYDNFKEIQQSKDSAKLKAVCIQKEHIKNYNLRDNEQAIKLLKKTRCVFLIDVKCDVDDIDNAEFFEMNINTGVLHPQFDEDRERILRIDLNSLSSPVKTQRFTKQQTIDVFRFTAESLLNYCQYILGLVYLLSKDFNEALNHLTEVKMQLEKAPIMGKVATELYEKVKDRLFVTCVSLSANNIECFEKGYDKNYLKIAKSLLEEANSIRPNTYFYNLNIAYISIILDRDHITASRCIEMCKKSKDLKEWLFSDAFIAAYTNQPAMEIYEKYKRALRQMPINLIKIEDYIEYVLKEEPMRTSLHLGVALVYEAANEFALAKYHFSNYLSCTQSIPQKLVDIINRKIDTMKCEKICDSNCIDCVDKSD